MTDADGRITGVHRTWLDRQGPEKAPLADPRRALRHLLGNGVCFGRAADVLAAGEGIETMLALKSVLPDLPMIAALSANHLAALDLAPMLARLYVARDRDAAGRLAAERLHARGRDAGIEVRDLMPARSDFNVDLRRLGPDVMLVRLADQLAPADVLRFVRRRDAARSEGRARHLPRFGVGPEGGRGGVRRDAWPGQRRAPAAFPSGDLPEQAPVRQWRPATIFRRRAAGRPALHREAK